LKTSPVGLAPIVADRDATYYSPDAGFRFQMSDEFSFFGRSALSIKPKGYSAFTDILGLAAFEDESARSNELGFEYATKDDVFSARVTAFDISIDDYQLERSVPQATDYIVITADEVSSSGLEAEMVWKPIPQFELEAGIGTNDVTFDNHVDPFTNAVLDGFDVPFTPEYTVRGSARYSFDNGVFLQGTFRSIGETFFDEPNSAMFRQGSYEVYDAQVGYRTDKYSVVIFGKNLGDEVYYTFINPQIFAATPGDPETFGIRLDTRF
jgi:iron complex outermembrane receptor protein